MKKKKNPEAKRELLPVAWQRFSSAETCANAREQSGFCLPTKAAVIACDQGHIGVTLYQKRKKPQTQFGPDISLKQEFIFKFSRSHLKKPNKQIKKKTPTCFSIIIYKGKREEKKCLEFYLRRNSPTAVLPRK